MDFLRQRRRWTCGIWNPSGGLKAAGLIGKGICWLNANWIRSLRTFGFLGFFPPNKSVQILSLSSAYIFLYPTRLRLPLWLYLYICFYNGAQTASLTIACVMQVHLTGDFGFGTD